MSRADDLPSLALPHVTRLHAYTPGLQPTEPGWTKLNTNECPYPPSPLALARMAEAVDDRLRLYPDPQGLALRDAVANRFGLRREQVFVGNGSDEVLAHAFMALMRHGKPVLTPDVSYSFYPVYCNLYGIEHVEVPLDDSLRVRVADYQRPNGGIVIPNPNAPTGVALPLSEVRRLLDLNRDSVVLVDEPLPSRKSSPGSTWAPGRTATTPAAPCSPTCCNGRRSKAGRCS